jgi:hypothetical protein
VKSPPDIGCIGHLFLSWKKRAVQYILKQMRGGAIMSCLLNQDCPAYFTVDSEPRSLPVLCIIKELIKR